MAAIRGPVVYACVGWLVLSVSAAFGEDSGDLLTLEEAITLALLDNPSVENATLDVEKDQDDIDAARTYYFPQLNATLATYRNLVQQSYTFEQGAFGTYPVTGPIPANTTELDTSGAWSKTVGLTITQSLSGIYEVSLDVEKLTLEQQISAQNLRAELQNTAKEVKQTYYQILANQSELENSQASIDLYQSLVDQLTNEVAQQTALDYELLDAQAKLADAQQQARTERSDIADEKEKLNNLMGRDTQQPFELAGNLVAQPVVVDGEEARTLALQQRPEMREAEYNVLLAEKNVAIDEYGYVPDVDLVLDYSHNDSSVIPNDSLYVGVFLSWEIYDWGRRSSQISSATVSVSQARIDVASTRADIIADVNSSLRDLEDAQADVDVARLAQQAGTERLRVTLNRYNEHVDLLTDVFDAESQLSEANSDYIDAVLSVLNAQAELANAMGDD